jgi:hypothetical protein
VQFSTDVLYFLFIYEQADYGPYDRNKERRNETINCIMTLGICVTNLIDFIEINRCCVKGFSNLIIHNVLLLFLSSERVRTIVWRGNGTAFNGRGCERGKTSKSEL